MEKKVIKKCNCPLCVYTIDPELKPNHDKEIMIKDRKDPLRIAIDKARGDCYDIENEIKFLNGLIKCVNP